MRNDVAHELRQAATESSRGQALMDKLRATALGSGNSELRMAAQFRLDTIIWKQRNQLHDRTDDTPTKIDIAKLNGERTRAVRRRTKRIEAGLRTRRPRHPVGTMTAGERRDGFAATDGKCLACGGHIARDRSRTCSARCARAIRAARRKRGMNHG